MGLTLYIFAGFGAVFLIGIAGLMVYQLSPEANRRAALLSELPWFFKGLVLPFGLWMLMNIGLSFELQPFMPAIQKAQNAGDPWFFIFLRVVTTGLFLITTYWAAITIGWAAFRASRGIEGEARDNFRALCLTCFVGAALPNALLLWFGGWFTLGVALLFIALPIAGYGQDYLRPAKQRPMYSRAIARMKFGKYSEAEWEIIRQLERAENDFDGWLMLADLQANHFKDIAEAEQIILDICNQPKVTPSQISVALHKLADWQLAIANNPEAADHALQAISSLLPGTHLARMAKLRRAQLPRNAEELQEQRQPRPIRVPVVPSLLTRHDPPPPEEIAPPPNVATSALDLVNQLSETLTQNPDSISDREKLARLLAEPLGKADLAIEQIELLLAMGNQPDVKRVEWLTLIAGWQLQLQQDETAASATLTKIVQEFPNTPQAFTAQRRLSLMKAEAAARKD